MAVHIPAIMMEIDDDYDLYNDMYGEELYKTNNTNMETTSIERIKLLHPKIVDEALKAYTEAVNATPVNIHPFITEGLRSFKESDALYQQGRTKPGQIVTDAPGGTSFHNYGLAIDFVIQENGHSRWDVNKNWMTVVNIFKNYGWEWGGDWVHIIDRPHLQKTFGYTYRQLLEKHNNKDFISGTSFLNL